ILLLIARFAVICFSCLLVYIALFMYEDEKGRLQNRLEELWIRIDDRQRAAAARHIAFLKAVLGLLSRGFDSLFGTKIFSLRSIAVTFCFSQASLLLLLPYDLLDFEYPKVALRAVAYFVALVVLGTSSIMIKGKKAVAIWSCSVIAISTLIFLGSLGWVFNGDIGWTNTDMSWDFSSGGVGWILTVFGAGIACDILFVALNRAIIRFTARLNGSVQIIAMLIANCAIATLYMAPYWLWPLRIVTRLSPIYYQIANLTAATNFITSLLACSIILMMAIALLHRVSWSLVSRPIYAISQFKVARKPGLLLPASIVLLAWALPAWEPLLQKLKDLK
ncbi:MAG TPA: hypothetical protein VI685_06730, partial [Candidatus Angelobacter sp.]